MLVAPAARAWRLEPLMMDEAGATAVAVSGDGRVAVGDGRGVWLGDAEGGFARVELRGGVRDLAFAADASLYVASDAGLLRVAGGRKELRAPAPGEAARDVRRVATSGAIVAAASAAGVFWSTDGQRFARVEVAAGEAPASGLALEAGPHADTVLWIATERGLFSVALAARDGAGVLRAERVAAPIDLRPAYDVWSGDGRVVALGRTHVLVRAAGGAFSAREAPLPPGAAPLRV
ncbi:MAG: hypothetical protein DCC71_25290, partial [Proteobacteria bacterium]